MKRTCIECGAVGTELEIEAVYFEEENMTEYYCMDTATCDANIEMTK